MVDFIQRSFRTGRIPKEANETLICLIPPEVTPPERLSQFRPILLCNVVVKLVTKILAIDYNRIYAYALLKS